jgi:hypothetical protein
VFTQQGTMTCQSAPTPHVTATISCCFAAGAVQGSECLWCRACASWCVQMRLTKGRGTCQPAHHADTGPLTVLDLCFCGLVCRVRAGPLLRPTSRASTSTRWCRTTSRCPQGLSSSHHMVCCHRCTGGGVGRVGVSWVQGASGGVVGCMVDCIVSTLCGWGDRDMYSCC